MSKNYIGSTGIKKIFNLIKSYFPTSVDYSNNETWIPAFKIHGWGIIVVIPIMNDKIQKITVTSSRIFTETGWHNSTVTDIAYTGSYVLIVLKIENEDKELTKGNVYLCGIKYKITIKK